MAGLVRVLSDYLNGWPAGQVQLVTGATGDVFEVHIVSFLARLPQINGTALLDFLCVCSSGGTKVGHDIKTNPPAAPHCMVSISRRISILTLLLLQLVCGPIGRCVFTESQPMFPFPFLHQGSSMRNEILKIDEREKKHRKPREGKKMFHGKPPVLLFY
jgi:hypothetical protein